MKQPDDSQSQNLLLEDARRHLTQGRPEQAQAILDGLLETNPRNIQAVGLLGAMAMQTGHRDVAIKRLRAVIDSDPNNVPALCWICFLLLAENGASEAKPYALRAVSLDGGNGATHGILGKCLVEEGNHAEAIPVLQKATSLQPTNPTPLYELAGALLELGQDAEGLEALRRATQLAPHPRGLLRMATVEFGLGRLDEAEKTCRRALQMEPGLVGAHLLMGRIQTERFQPEQAAEHWRQAERLHAEPGSINLQQALSLATIGQFEEAIDQFTKSIDAHPEQGPAYQALVFAKRIGPDDLPLVEKMESLVAAATLPERDQVLLLYSLGKAHDNLGDYERAIGYFDRANALNRRVRGLKPFDRKAFSARIDAKIKLFSPAFFKSWKQPRSESKLPILVVGMMRSGTTLAEQMLSCHPQVGGAGEQLYWGEHEASFVDYGGRRVDGAGMLRVAKGYVSLLQGLAPDFERVIDKNPANVLLLGSLHLAFPRVPLIHTRRNAVDTALSIWMTPMTTHAEFVGDRESIAFAVQEYLRLMEHWREVLPANRLAEVRYEDLVADPETHAKAIVDFCGLPWDEACLHPERNRRRILTPSFWQVRQPVYTSSTERWKKYQPWLGAFEDLQGLA